MTPNNGKPTQPSSSSSPGLISLPLPKQTNTAGRQSVASSMSNLPYHVSSVFASTSTPPESGTVSPTGGTASSKSVTGSVFMGTPIDSALNTSDCDQSEDPRQLILQAYVPHIAVYTSRDTDELTDDKGFPQGLWQLLRPFGERVQGKIIIRDSVGLSKACDDFAVRFVELGEGLQESGGSSSGRTSTESQTATSNGMFVSHPSHNAVPSRYSRYGGDIDMIENVVDKHLSYAETFSQVKAEGYFDLKTDPSQADKSMSPFYRLYIRKLLSGIPLAPHETFSHPVACIIAISSRNTNPIETLRLLYDDSSHGDKRLPLWVNSEYLRYYVLVHDEERDDINKSITLFDQMKRHFGLHCHLLRLRSTQCVPTDDDSYRLPQCNWTSASEELADIQAKEMQEDFGDNPRYIFESDATAIRTFIREMITQSVIPSMERCVSTWNDQVASRRRGIGGRILNVTKKWSYFGGGSRNSAAPGSSGGVSGSNSNYDALQGFYRPDAPEAIMRKLADYAFMLRDWKLAHSVYDLLRTDFHGDKAWKYHAAANEMAAISTLLSPQVLTSKVRLETVDQTLETASYSYLTRCGASYGALRCLILGMELLRIRPGSAVDDAARWGSKLLEMGILGAVGGALVKERVAVCYVTQKGSGSGAWGARNRKAAMWNVLAAEEWLSLRKYLQAGRRLNEVKVLYAKLANRNSLSQFIEASTFLAALERELYIALSPVDGGDDVPQDESISSMDEESEALDLHSRRKSLMGATTPAISNLETAPLNITHGDFEDSPLQDDDFE